MSWPGSILRKLIFIFQRSRLEAELAEEMQLHLEMKVEELTRSGLDSEQAWRVARREFGNVMSIQEMSRAAWGWAWLEALWGDLHYTIRTLTRASGYSLLIVTILALTIGANAGIFTLIYSVLLKPLPYPEAERLVSILEENEIRGQSNGPSPPNFRDWYQQCSQFEALLAVTPTSFIVEQGETPRRTLGLSVTPGFLSTLGAQLQKGRAFQPEDSDSADILPTVVTQEFWRRFLQSDPDPIGRLIGIGKGGLQVVGVLSSGFYYPADFDLLVPLRFEDSELTEPMRGARYLQVLGKLKAGVSREQARAELESITGSAAQNKAWSVRLVPLLERIVGAQQSQLLLLGGAVAFLLLVACANVGGLLLSRISSRGRELALRAALGARRWRLVRQILSEMVILFVIGGLVGIILANWTLDTLLRLAPEELPRTEDLSVGWPVLIFTLLLSVSCGLIFGLLPALSCTRFRTFDLSSLNTRGIAGPSLKSRKTLVVAEVALSLVLLISAGLLTRSLQHLQRVDPGFRAEGTAAFTVVLPEDRYDSDAARLEFVQQILSEIETLPSVASVAASTNLPLSGSNMSFGYQIPGYENEAEQFAQYHTATADYFETMGIPIISGREFSKGDRAESAPVILVNDSLADRYWPRDQALGKKILHSSRSGLQERVIVGVVGSVKHSALEADSSAEIYVPYAQDAWNFLSFVVRFSDQKTASFQTIRERIWSLDPFLPLDRIDSLSDWAIRSQQPFRFRTTLLLFFALTSLLLACVGVYAVLSYLVSQKRCDIGLRMALGANRFQILREVLAGGLSMVGAGIGIGLLGSMATSRLLTGFLFEVEALDPPTLLAVTLFFLLAASLACLIPAGRATSVDPAIALREE